MAVHARLTAFLEEVHQRMLSASAEETVFELTDLSFMSSTCLSLLLRFLNGIAQLPAHDRYTVRFRTNPNLRWQIRMVAMLHDYAADVVVIE
ncbi:MAG: hypothetical protein ACRENE_32765 [Polyangiaceae bacterium]